MKNWGFTEKNRGLWEKIGVLVENDGFFGK